MAGRASQQHRPPPAPSKRPGGRRDTEAVPTGRGSGRPLIAAPPCRAEPPVPGGTPRAGRTPPCRADPPQAAPPPVRSRVRGAGRRACAGRRNGCGGARAAHALADTGRAAAAAGSGGRRRGAAAGSGAAGGAARPGGGRGCLTAPPEPRPAARCPRRGGGRSLFILEKNKPSVQINNKVHVVESCAIYLQ